MVEWDEVRLAASACRRAACVEVGETATVRALLDAAIRLAGLEEKICPDGVILPAHTSGLLHRDAGMVYVAARVPESERLFLAAHELGHYRLHTDPALALRGTTDGSRMIYASAAYSWREPIEVAADTFAREFLCPVDELRTFLIAGGTVAGYAMNHGLARELVVAQALRALLPLPPASIPSDHLPLPPKLDPEQLRAVEAPDRIVLVEGRPGSGKTTVVAERTVRLLQREKSPGSIAVFTHSESAARRLRALVAARRPTDAAQIWSGTFRSLSLQILQAHHGIACRSRHFKILDEIGLAAAFEQSNGRRSRNAALPRRREFILRLRERALDKAGRRAESKSVDVAPGQTFSAALDGLLRELDAYGAGDLTPAAVDLLESHPHISAPYRKRFRHIVIDDLQDACQADLALIRAVMSPQTTLFALGDPGLCTERYLGASLKAITDFPTTFGGVRLQITGDRRCGPHVAQAAAAFVRTGRTPGRKGASQFKPCSTSIYVATDLQDEAVRIATEARRLASNGVPLGEQVVLARTHGVLEPLAKALKAIQVEVAYVGDFPERSEVGELLALCALGLAESGDALARLLRRAPYNVRTADTLAVHAAVAASRGQPRDALAAAAKRAAPSARAGLQKLVHELEGLDDEVSPWTLLTTWLFDRSDYLRNLMKGGERSSKALASVYHLLMVCAEQDAQRDTDRTRLVQRVRRIASINQDTDYSKTAHDAASGGGLQLMTINASKGREFAAVHIAGLSALYIPSPRSRMADPTSGVTRAESIAQEEALFLVALTRAKGHLALTRARRYGARRGPPSPFLERLFAKAK